MQPSFYLTTAIPYVNAKPHLGHILEWFQADAIAQFHRCNNEEVFFASGSDENSLKNIQAAEKAGTPIQDWLDEYAQVFKQANKDFGITLTHFGRGSDSQGHWPGVQKLWELCQAHGDLYKKTYEGLYCVGCESFYTTTDLIDGKCPEHLTVPETVKEENYFFKLSKYADQIRELIASDTLRIVSEQYKKEVLSFIDQGLEDFSVSRSTERARGLGVPVPGDASQVMYVWFDALAIYLTAIGWGSSHPEDQAAFAHIWPANVHCIGKGIVRFHAVYWIGMLLSAGLNVPKAINVHGYLTVNGQKMSKSLGNVIDPIELVNRYGLEAVRYYLLAHVPAHTDGDFSDARFAEVYTADLANGLGNLCSRVAALAAKSELQFPLTKLRFAPEFTQFFANFETTEAAMWLRQEIAQADQFLSETKPWTLSGDELEGTLQKAVIRVRSIAYHLQPFMPTTAQTIIRHFAGTKIEKLQPLFPRLEQ